MLQTTVKLDGKQLSFPVSYLLDRAIHTIQRTCRIMCAAAKCPLALHLYKTVFNILAAWHSVFGCPDPSRVFANPVIAYHYLLLLLMLLPVLSFTCGSGPLTVREDYL